MFSTLLGGKKSPAAKTAPAASSSSSSSAASPASAPYYSLFFEGKPEAFARAFEVDTEDRVRALNARTTELVADLKTKKDELDFTKKDADKRALEFVVMRTEGDLGDAKARAGELSALLDEMRAAIKHCIKSSTFANVDEDMQEALDKAYTQGNKVGALGGCVH